MRKALWTLLLLGVSSAVKRMQVNQGPHMKLTRLKMSLMYLQAIKTFRSLFLSLLGLGLCMVFLFMGLVLFHVTLFVYSPWSMGTKMLIGFICAAGYLLMTLTIFYKIFSQDKWLVIFHAKDVMKQIQGDLGEGENER